jgi:hypothetical protein
MDSNMKRYFRLLAFAPLLGMLGLARAQDAPRVDKNSKPQTARRTALVASPKSLNTQGVQAEAVSPVPAEPVDPTLVEPPHNPAASSVPAGDCPECDSSEDLGPVRRHWVYKTKPRLQYTHWGYPEEFCHRPFGSYMRMAVDAQISSGYRAQLVLYHYDFAVVNGVHTDQLNDKGRTRLARFGEIMSVTPYSLVIEVDNQRDALNEARRKAVTTQLQAQFDFIVDERVVIGLPPTRGLSADEANAIQQSLIRQTRSGATSSASSSNMSQPQIMLGGSGAQGSNSSGSNSGSSGY